MILAKELWQKLEKLGENSVRKQLAEGVFGPNKIPLVEAWLAKKDSENAQASTQHQEVRETKALELSADANSIARRANRIAWIAIILSVLAFVLSLIIEILRFVH